MSSAPFDDTNVLFDELSNDLRGGRFDVSEWRVRFARGWSREQLTILCDRFAEVIDWVVELDDDSVVAATIDGLTSLFSGLRLAPSRPAPSYERLLGQARPPDEGPVIDAPVMTMLDLRAGRTR